MLGADRLSRYMILSTRSAMFFPTIHCVDLSINTYRDIIINDFSFKKENEKLLF